jgi:hypothetical protein
MQIRQQLFVSVSFLKYYSLIILLLVAYILNCRHCPEIHYKIGKGIKLILHLVLLNDSRVQKVTFFIHLFAFVLHGWYTTTGRSNCQKYSSKYQLEPVLLQTKNTVSILYNFLLYINECGVGPSITFCDMTWGRLCHWMMSVMLQNHKAYWELTKVISRNNTVKVRPCKWVVCSVPKLANQYVCSLLFCVCVFGGGAHMCMLIIAISLKQYGTWNWNLPCM